MATDEFPGGVLGIDPACMHLLAWKDSEAHVLARAAQREALRLIDQLAAHMKTLGLTPAQVEEKSGLPAAMVTEGLESGEISFADYMIIARVLGVRVMLGGIPVTKAAWPEAANVGSPRQDRWTNPEPDEAPEAALATAA
jgi:hypothetical protein